MTRYSLRVNSAAQSGTGEPEPEDELQSWWLAVLVQEGFQPPKGQVLVILLFLPLITSLFLLSSVWCGCICCMRICTCTRVCLV